MIWSLIKLVFGVCFLFSMFLGNCFTWILCFKWNNDLFVLFFTDKEDGEDGVQYYYKGNILAWAFKIKKLADSSFDLKNKIK